jgi:alcohol dehydrogenase class IV
LFKTRFTVTQTQKDSRSQKETFEKRENKSMLNSVFPSRTFSMPQPFRLQSIFKLRRNLVTTSRESLDLEFEKSCSSLTRVSVSFTSDPSKGVSNLASHIPRLFPSLSSYSQSGLRCLVVASATSAVARRAQIVPHFLRRSGYFPLLCELTDLSPTALQVEAVVEQARRAGAVQLVVAFGSASVLSVGRAVSILLSTHPSSKVRDFVPAMGGKLSLSTDAVPFLAIPSCPAGGVETSRESFILHDGTTLASFQSTQTSEQGCFIDPSLSTSLINTPQLVVNFSTLIHCIEAYTRTDSSSNIRHAAWRSLILVVKNLSQSLLDPKDLSARSSLLMASALIGSSLSTGPLGPSRGIALSIASRYRIPYSSAITAMAPDIISSVAEFLESKLEEEEEEEEAEEGGSEMKWSDNVGLDEKKSLQKSSSWTRKNAFSPPSIRATSSSKYNRSKIESRPSLEEVRENALQDRQLEVIAKIAKAEAAEEEQAFKAEEGGSDIKLAVNRYRHVVYALRCALTDITRLDTELFTLQHVQSLRKDQLGSLLELGPLLKELRACSHGFAKHGARVPTIHDFALTDKDINEIADVAEVDENTLSSLVTLKHRDIFDLIKRS